MEYNFMEAAYEKILPLIQLRFKAISDLMSTIGVGTDTEREWENNIVSEFHTLLNDMQLELEQKKTHLVDTITKVMNDTRKIGMELQLPSLPNLEDQLKPLYVMLEEANAEFQRLGEQREMRIKQIMEVQEKEQRSCEQMDREPKEIWNPSCLYLPTEAELAEYEHHIERVEQELFERREEYFTLKSAIKENAELLRFVPVLDFQRTVLFADDENAFKLSDSNMVHLRSFARELQDSREKLTQDIQTLREKLQTLWELLEVSPQERSSFLKNNGQNDKKTLESLKREISKYEEQKRQNIAKFLERLRRDLTEIWDRCLLNEQQRFDFFYFSSGDFNEDVLEHHEVELEKWKKHYERNADLYSLIEKRAGVIIRLDELNDAARNPDRFKNRGGKLLKDEQERKAAESSLPKLEKKMIQLAEQFEENNNGPFLVHGVDLKKIISDRSANGKFTLQTPAKVESTPLKASTTCRSKLVTPCSARKTPNARTAPGKMNQVKSGKVEKTKLMSTERNKKVKTALKMSVQQQENEPNLINVAVTKEYSDFVNKGTFTRSTLIAPDGTDLGVCPLAKSPFKRPLQGISEQSPLFDDSV